MGIQLIPLTPVAETRDDIDWATMMYPKYDKACKAQIHKLHQHKKDLLATSLKDPRQGTRLMSRRIQSDAPQALFAILSDTI